ncbi:MAG TPA: helix-turn-helix domain-containing protein [Candidatus Elarobacter sp.]|jgi:DeoR family suf operon transcriptional repressor|nr:helix-turn-helix domain-containing protein [Candidatus Elarobacter sp.]
MHDRFFDSTRGKIVGALRERRSASAFDLAEQFGLSPNAIRQQLVILERDGLIAGRSVRRGRTKPTVEYSLTPEASRYFPQRYDKMLNAVLREIRTAGGDDAVKAVFERIGKRAADRIGEATADRPAEERLEKVVSALKASGVTAELQKTEPGKLVLHEHSCPYAAVVAENPECCSAIHTILDRVAPGNAQQVESLATGGTECRFEINVDTTPRETAATA